MASIADTPIYTDTITDSILGSQRRWCRIYNQFYFLYVYVYILVDADLLITGARSSAIDANVGTLSDTVRTSNPALARLLVSFHNLKRTSSEGSSYVLPFLHETSTIQSGCIVRRLAYHSQNPPSRCMTVIPVIASVDVMLCSAGLSEHVHAIAT